MTAQQNSNPAKNPQNDDNVFTAVSSVSAQLAAIEKFIARRFDEISMEINATSQQMDQAEESMVGRFGEILGVLKAISFSGDGATPANAGVELDAVVSMTEQAANRILDAADRIASRVRTEGDWTDAAAREEARNTIDKDIEEIFMACSFQDITGQRIRKTLENLKAIEDRLGAALGKLGIEVDASANPNLGKATSQDDIDALFKSSGG
jgi:chemotaxis regulatin CheY-phosphate phosphatase CheZ